jgi:soluble lytic murein transglycosylase
MVQKKNVKVSKIKNEVSQKKKADVNKKKVDKKENNIEPAQPIIKKIKKSIPKIYLILGGSIFLFTVLFLAGGYVYYTYKNAYLRMERISRELVNLRSAMNIDSVRQFKLQKILKILYSHNTDLTSEEAYDIASEIYEMSFKYTNLDVDLLCAVITHESAITWNPEIVSPAGAMGLMQIMPVTGLFLAQYEGITWTTPEEVLFNPTYNIRMGSRLLSLLIGEYGLDGALAAYNGGEKQAALWLANGRDEKYLWEETRRYIPAIRKLYDDYLSEGM